MSINAKTKLCCIIGNPVEHSLSPLMHNAGYKALGLNFVYMAFQISDVANAIAGIRALGIHGTSVTVPHKLTVMKYLDEIDETAKAIGAVNTIINDQAKLTGTNTDYEGAIRALEEKTKIEEKRVTVVGAGGAARAIAFGLKQKKAKIKIINRTKERAQALAKEVRAEHGDLTDLSQIKNSDILIHATITGMHPDNKSLVPKEYLHKNLVVFDVVYNPRETKLINDAKKAGCQIVYGYKMLLYQAVAQFELFTGVKAPVEVMEEALLKGLAKHE
ncbi:shikimate dehydrogenase [Candidatus Microgenomates bacterium]|nr:shikimate dehydrogenase [Candidatus Microgenomates bacterium]